MLWYELCLVASEVQALELHGVLNAIGKASNDRGFNDCHPSAYDGTRVEV